MRNRSMGITPRGSYPRFDYFHAALHGPEATGNDYASYDYSVAGTRVEGEFQYDGDDTDIWTDNVGSLTPDGTGGFHLANAALGQLLDHTQVDGAGGVLILATMLQPSTDGTALNRFVVAGGAGASDGGGVSLVYNAASPNKIQINYVEGVGGSTNTLNEDTASGLNTLVFYADHVNDQLTLIVNNDFANRKTNTSFDTEKLPSNPYDSEDTAPLGFSIGGALGTGGSWTNELNTNDAVDQGGSDFWFIKTTEDISTQLATIAAQFDANPRELPEAIA